MKRKKLSIVAIIIACISLSVTCASCKSGPDVYVALDKNDFIVTNPGDQVGDEKTTKPGAWYSDQVILDQFGVMVRRKTE